MISFDFRSYRSQIDSLMDRYRQLPRHVARKHLKAAMKRTVKGGVPVLKKLTPKGDPTNKRNAVTRNAKGQFEKGSGKKIRVRGGALRRAVTSKAAWIGKAKAGFVVGVVGYRGGLQSRKAIWLEYGTNRLTPRAIIPKFVAAYGKPQAKELAREMRKALGAAARDLGGKPIGRK